MAPKDEKSLYDDLDALTAGTDVPAAEEDFSLEEILAEYGAGREQQILRDVERAAAPEIPSEEPAPVKEPVPGKEPEPEREAPDPEEERERARQEARDRLLAQAVDLEKLERELPRAPRPISLEEVVGSTVDAVMEERQEPLLKPRQGLFSRRKLSRSPSARSRIPGTRRRSTGRNTAGAGAACPRRRSSPCCPRQRWCWSSRGT